MPNTIADFTPDEDLIGFGGLGLAFGDLVLTSDDDGSLVAVPSGGGDVPVIRVAGIRPHDLDGADFVFA